MSKTKKEKCKFCYIKVIMKKRSGDDIFSKHHKTKIVCPLCGYEEHLYDGKRINE